MNNKFQKEKVITISSAHLFHDIFAAFLAPMLPLLIAKLGISLSMAALLDVIRKIPALFNPFLGLLADKMCLKYFIILMPGVTAASMCLLGSANSSAVVILLLFISGISSTLFHIPSPVLIKRFSGDKTATGMSFYMFGGEIARTLGPLLITASLSLWGLEGTYRLFPIGLLMSLILFVKLKDVSSVDRRKHKSASKIAGARESMKQFIPLFIFIAGFQLFRAGMKSALTLYLPTYLTGSGSTLWIAGVSLSALQLSGAVGTFMTGYISDKISHKKMLFISAVGTPLLMLGFIYSPEILKIPILILIGFLLFASGPILLTFVHETKTERPAFINSVYMTINFGVSSFIVFLVGILGDKIGLDFTYKICAILAFFSVPFIFFLPKLNKSK